MRISDYGQFRLELESGAWLIEDGKVSIIERDVPQTQPCVLITDFGGAPQGVERVKSQRRYAAAILERNLRDRGETESISQVLLLDTHTEAGITQALYHAVSTDDYLACKKRVNKSRDHLLVGSHLSLMLERARAEKVSHVCVLLQHGNCLDVLVLAHNRSVLCRRFSVSDGNHSEWIRTIQYVADEIHETTEKLNIELQYAIWADWNPMSSDISETLCDWLEANTIMQVSKDQPSLLTLGDYALRSALPDWIRRFHSKNAIFKMPSLLWYWSERLLPTAAVVMIAAGVALAAAGYQWHQQADAMEENQLVLAVDSDANALDQARQSLQQALPELPSAEVRQLIQTLTEAHEQFPLASVIADIQQAMTAETRLSSIRLDSIRGEPSLILDGWIDATPTNVNAGVERFIDHLSTSGYTVHDNGLSAYRQKNYFQIVLLIARGNLREV